MKRSAVLAPIAAIALAIVYAAPAQAAVTYSAVAAPLGQHPAVDSSAGIVYSATTSGDVGAATGVVYLQATDVKTLKVKSRTTIASGVNPLDPYTVTDIRVNAKTHVVWILVTGGKGGSHVEQRSGSTGALVHFFGLGGSYSDSLAVDSSNGNAYVGTEPNFGYGSTDDVPTVKSLNPSTGGIGSVAIPGYVHQDPSSVVMPYVAYDSANNGIYVSVGTNEYAYSDKLKLASTLKLGDGGYVTADGSTHTVYIAGAKKLYTIAGTTNRLTRSSPLAGTGLPVIDPSIKTIYVGKYAYSTTSGARTGTLPYAATSASGSTHTIYSGTEYQSKGYAITRAG